MSAPTNARPLALAFPVAAQHGATLVAVLLQMTDAERAAWWSAQDATTMAETYHTITDLLGVFDLTLHELDQSVRARWLDAGDGRFADAVRAHPVEHGTTRLQRAQAQRHLKSLVEPGAYQRQEQERLATLDARTAALLKTEQEYRDAITRLDEEKQRLKRAVAPRTAQLDKLCDIARSFVTDDALRAALDAEEATWQRS